MSLIICFVMCILKQIKKKSGCDHVIGLREMNKDSSYDIYLKLNMSIKYCQEILLVHLHLDKV